MSEHIGDITWGYGGHVWLWQGQQLAQKSVMTAGIIGAWSMVTAAGPRFAQIAGKEGYAILGAYGYATKALADAAVNASEKLFEDLALSGQEVAWEDDQGHTGTALVVVAYQRFGPRLYQACADGACWTVWQRCVVTVMENNGGF
jgi:hypothetical protein